MEYANDIMGYSHNNQSLFGKYKFKIPFNKEKTLITNVEGSTNISSFKPVEE